MDEDTREYTFLKNPKLMAEIDAQIARDARKEQAYWNGIFNRVMNVRVASEPNNPVLQAIRKSRAIK